MLPLLFAASFAMLPQAHAQAPAHGAVHAPEAPKADSPATPEAALEELKAGNARFVQGKRNRTTDPSKDAALREKLSKGQAPFAVIVTCADSRVPDALLFDQEMGRLFVVREAGNAPDLQGIASVDYAVEHLGSKVVVVMGHSACGAVTAVMDSNGKPLPGNLWVFQAGMAGLLESNQHDPNEDVKIHMGHLVEANAKRQAQVLVDRSEAIRHLVEGDKLTVVPAVYDLASGRISFFKPVVPTPPAAHH